MDAVEFLKELQRRSKNNPNYYGEELNIAYIEPVSLVAQVEEWAKEHPIKTRQSEFLKMFPNARLDECENIRFYHCEMDKTLFNVESCRSTCCEDCRYNYWLQKVEL